MRGNVCRAAVACWLGWALSLGCSGSASSPPANAGALHPEASATSAEIAANDQQPSADRSANDVLQKLLATYRQAQTYQDKGVVRLAYRQGGQPFSQEWPVAVAFERPGKLSLVAYQATVKCDGQEFKAQIKDDESKNVDGQIVVRPASMEFKLAELAADSLLNDIVSSQLRRQPIQLELLIASGGLVSAFGSDVACRRLDDAKQEGRTCYRIEVPSPGGTFVFWVDQTEFLLRRLDYPAAALFPDLASDSAINDLQVVAEPREAKIGGAIPPAQFELAVPAAAKRMKTFVKPPPPLPSALFGKQPAPFSFSVLSGGKVNQQDLAGKIAVLVWYHDNPACAATLEQVSLARQRLKDKPEAVFYAVATDPSSITGDILRARLAEWKADLPIVRDLEAFGDKAFKIEVQPTIVVLDKQGRVQIFQPGGNPQLADQLVTIVGRLIGGNDLAAEIVARNQRERQQYDQLVARGGPEPSEVVELPEAVIRLRSEPKHLKLQPLWTCSELKSAGNLVIVETPNQPPRIFILDGWRTIAEIDAAGKIIARHDLKLPEQAAITFARTAADKTGRRYFVGSAPLAPQLFLFDEQWKLLLAYPPLDQPPLAVVELALADVGEADGVPEILAASVGDVGLVALSLTGETRWRNRAFPNATSIAIAPPDDLGTWSIGVTGESGGILRVNRFGHEEPPVTISNWPILRLLAGRFASAKQAALLGLSNNAKGEPFAVGLTDKLKECWNYPLPVGAHQKPIEPIASSHVLPGHQGEWWLAGPDGSIHLITEDGELFDSFHCGAVLTGLAVTQFHDRPALLVATDKGVSAWEIALSPVAKPGREY